MNRILLVLLLLGNTAFSQSLNVQKATEKLLKLSAENDSLKQSVSYANKVITYQNKVIQNDSIIKYNQNQQISTLKEHIKDDCKPKTPIFPYIIAAIGVALAFLK